MSKAYMKKVKTRNKIFDLKKALADVTARIDGLGMDLSEYPAHIDQLMAYRDKLVSDLRVLGAV